jgi:hypothetical protein
LPVADIAIEEQPIEDVIGALFRTARNGKAAAQSHEAVTT